MTNKRMNFSTIIALAVLVVLGTDRTHAQSVPNLSGEWKVNIALSDYGTIPAPRMLTRTIAHDDPSLHISTHHNGAQGETTPELIYTTDGRGCVNKIRLCSSVNARVLVRVPSPRIRATASLVLSYRIVRGTP